MRDNYDRPQVGVAYVTTKNECSGQTTVITNGTSTVAHEYKYGSSGVNPNWPYGVQEPQPCDIGFGRSTVAFGQTKSAPSLCGYDWIDGKLEPKYGTTAIADYGTGFTRASQYHTTVVDQQLVDDCVREFYLEVADLKVNLAASLAQYNQTIDMVANRTNQLAHAAKQLKRGNFYGVCDTLGIKRRSDLPGTFSKSWLELTYGWKPLLSDIHGALRLVGDRPLRRFVEVRKRSSNSVELSGHNGDFPHTGTCSITDSVTSKALITVTDNNLQTLQQAGITNPALLAWELLPWSFVVDWIYPIGDWLQARTAMQGVTVSQYSLTRTREINVQADLKAPLFIKPAQFNGYEKRKQRSTVLPPLPSPVIQVPSTSLTRLTTATALLAQVFSSDLKKLLK